MTDLSERKKRLHPLPAGTSETPRTDHVEGIMKMARHPDSYAQEREELYAFTRQLELELAAKERELADYKKVVIDKKRLTRELDVAIHGETDAAKQASLCDLIPLAKRLRERAERAEAALADLKATFADYRGAWTLQKERAERAEAALAAARPSEEVLSIARQGLGIYFSSGDCPPGSRIMNKRILMLAQELLRIAEVTKEGK